MIETKKERYSLRFLGWYCSKEFKTGEVILWLKRNDKILMEIDATVVYNAPNHALFQLENQYIFSNCISIKDMGNDEYHYVLDKDGDMGMQICGYLPKKLCIIITDISRLQDVPKWEIFSFTVPEIADGADLTLNETNYVLEKKFNTIEIAPIFQVFTENER